MSKGKEEVQNVPGGFYLPSGYTGCRATLCAESGEVEIRVHCENEEPKHEGPHLAIVSWHNDDGSCGCEEAEE